MTELKVALGKKAYKHSPLTVRLARYLAPPPHPVTFDFDKGRAALPIQIWGNDEWGDCVEVGKYHGLARLERIERRATLTITTNDVVVSYKHECLEQNGGMPQSPGDQFDTGLVVLDSLGRWRTQGLKIATKPNPFKIAAYGELSNDREELRAGCFLLRGLYFGLNLPTTAASEFQRQQPWRDTSGVPGSWGGHLVYSKRYDAGGFYPLTWGVEHYMTNGFIERYADEVWAVVDALDFGTPNRYLDVGKLTQYLRDIGASNIG